MISRAMACVGAVLGAGFASGREIVSFFSRYGAHAWWLMILAAAVMAGLCWIAMHMESSGLLARGCMVALSALTGGAMVAASGGMVALCWSNEWAYSLGAVGTLALAWCMTRGSMRPLSLVSTVLSAVFVAALLIGQRVPPGEYAAQQAPLSGAAIRAVGYAAMNMTLSMGVAQRCSKNGENVRMALLFGCMMFALMALSHLLYGRHPEWMGETFPIVRALSAFGRAGFWVSVALMYLAILTSLAAVLCTLESALGNAWLAMGLPLLLSIIGFEGIVDRLYAPAGLICLFPVFRPLDNLRRIRYHGTNVLKGEP